jgi:hypothetical protein
VYTRKGDAIARSVVGLVTLHGVEEWPRRLDLSTQGATIDEPARCATMMACKRTILSSTLSRINHHRKVRVAARYEPCFAKRERSATRVEPKTNDKPWAHTIHVETSRKRDASSLRDPRLPVRVGSCSAVAIRCRRAWMRHVRGRSCVLRDDEIAC